MDKNTKTTVYTRKIGNTTLIVTSRYTGTKTLEDAFEELLLSEFRKQYGGEHFRETPTIMKRV